MHTSDRLCATDFHYWRCDHGQPKQIDFADFCPDYHAQDRIGVVSLLLEDGVLHTAAALLALTTAFYDWQRARANAFFDYPQHFAVVGATSAGLQTALGALPPDTPHLWDSWSWLDLWPDNKWLAAAPTATSVLKLLFDRQINRLFWPRQLRPSVAEAPLPSYVIKMLRTSLKQVLLYGPADVDRPGSFDRELRTSEAGQALIRESIDRLVSATGLSSATDWAGVERYQEISVPEFLAAFAQPPPT